MREPGQQPFATEVSISSGVKNPGNQLRWGVLGAASIARRRFIPAIQASTNGRVVAIASRDQERARGIAAEHGLPVVHPDYDTLLNDPTIDAIYLPLPNSEHRHWAIAAVQAGKHVLCEKPIALNAREAEEMVAAAQAAGVLLAEAFMYRFHPRFIRMMELIRDGAIGTPRIIRFTFAIEPRSRDDIRLNPMLGGGVLMDLGCYGVNIARLVAGREPDKVVALAHFGADSSVDEDFGAVMDFGEMTFATLDVSFHGMGGSGYEVIGTEGKIVIPAGVRPETNQPTELLLYRGWQREEVQIEGADQYRLLAEDFADAIIMGRAPRYGPEDAVANMRVIDALYAAARARG